MSLRRTAHARRLAGLGAIGLTLATTEARADEGFALSRFEPAPAGDRQLGVPSPYTAGAPSVHGLPLHLMLLADYAHAPLVIHGSGSGKNLGSIVSDQLVLHLNGSFALFQRLTLNVDVPAAFQAGGGASAAGLSFAAPAAAGFGDIRFGARVTLFGRYFEPFQLAVGGMVWLPSGSLRAYAGDGKVRGEPQLIAGGYVDRRLVWSAAVGPRLRGATPIGDLRPASSLQWGGAVGFLLDEDRVLQLGPQLTGAIDLNDPQARTTNVEILLAGRRRFQGALEAGGGMGIGLAPGLGTPSFRAVAMLSYSPEALPFVPRDETRPDRDHDGIPDARDACPNDKGVTSEDPEKNGCPRAEAKLDRDHDGVPDADDVCPDSAGIDDRDRGRRGCPPPHDSDSDGIDDAYDACPDTSGPYDPDPTKSGCLPPADGDGDGVPDALDACPDKPGVPTSEKTTNGCPGDSDSDGIPDDKDACPAEKGPASAAADKNGCPTEVRVTKGAIVLLEQVQFESSTAAIQKVSTPVLDQIAAVLKEHPEILRVEVQGHTDNKGTKAGNTLLSQRRAESVVKALIKRGIDDKRLLAKGHGPDRPIAANLTTEGRAMNRRVEIKILETRGK
ncbi:MAG: OmpA family protein [Minicystis sp.]